MEEWLELPEPWQVCLDVAWEAFLAGTIPVGAAVAAADSSVVARGRNRIFEAPGEGLSGSRLAHAEIDALIKLDGSKRYRDHVLYSTLEPCLLCVAAALHATVGRIEYAAADAFGGGCAGTIDTAHWRRSAPQIAELCDGWWPGPALRCAAERVLAEAARALKGARNHRQLRRGRESGQHEDSPATSGAPAGA